MIPHIMSFTHGLIGRSLPLLLAFQPAARPSGGSGGVAAHPGGGGGGGGALSSSNPMSQIFMLVAVVGFMYLFVLRPENKRRKEQEDLTRALRPGDKVVTTGGMVGSIVSLDDKELTLEIADKIKVRFMREAVVRKYEAPVTVTATASTSSSASGATSAKKS